MTNTQIILLIFGFILLIFTPGYYSVKKTFVNHNRQFLKNAVKRTAVLKEVLNIRTISNSNNKIEHSAIFMGQLRNYSNIGIVTLLDAGRDIYCTFKSLAIPVNYPEIFVVYVGSDRDTKKIVCYSEDYFYGSKFLDFVFLGIGMVGTILVTVAIFI